MEHLIDEQHRAPTHTTTLRKLLSRARAVPRAIPQLSNQQHAELILLYETAVLEIAGFKQQQWAATYYVLVAQAAAVAIAQAISTNLQQIDRYVLVVLVALGLAFGVTVLRTLQISIECRRDRLRVPGGEVLRLSGAVLCRAPCGPGLPHRKAHRGRRGRPGRRCR